MKDRGRADGKPQLKRALDQHSGHQTNASEQCLGKARYQYVTKLIVYCVALKAVNLILDYVSHELRKGMRKAACEPGGVKTRNAERLAGNREPLAAIFFGARNLG